MLSASAPIRFDRKKAFRSGSEQYQAQFLSLFHRYSYIFKPLAGGAWSSAPETWCLSDSEILKAIACLHPKFLLGCRAAKFTRYAVLDIDSGSKHHSKIELDRLLNVLKSAGIENSSLFRSSLSGGWHLYLFFEGEINSNTLRRELLKLLSLNDFEIARGVLEIFPNKGRDSLGNGLRLPLQEGFAWLNKNDLEVEFERAQLSPTKALEFFIDEMDSDFNSFQSFEQLKRHNANLQRAKARPSKPDSINVLPLKREFDKRAPSEYDTFVASVFEKLPPGIIAVNWYKGRQFHLYGLSACSQRAEAIICVGHYLFYGDPSRNISALGYGYEQERELALRKFISSRHNNLSKDVNNGDPDALAQIERAAGWRPPDKNHSVKHFTERPISWILANEKSKIDARHRITQALHSLKEQQREFTTIELQELAGCSRQTLYKHTDIWRATYEDRKSYAEVSEGFFASCTPEYNAAVVSSSSKSLLEFSFPSTLSSIDSSGSISSSIPKSLKPVSHFIESRLPVFSYLKNRMSSPIFSDWKLLGINWSSLFSSSFICVHYRADEQSRACFYDCLKWQDGYVCKKFIDFRKVLRKQEALNLLQIFRFSFDVNSVLSTYSILYAIGSRTKKMRRLLANSPHNTCKFTL